MSQLLDRVADFVGIRRPIVPVGSRSPRIAILGAGVGGINAAVRLKQAGIESFTIYEKSDGVGGTWRDNSYPGSECDVPSHFYSYSFAPNPGWSKVWAGQAEILAYLDQVADDFAIRPHLRANTAIKEARYDDPTNTWKLTTAAGEHIEVDIVISGLGQLNVPLIPDLPGLDEFDGVIFHSARWRHDVDLTGRRVAVIGNGASAVQFVPQIAKQVAHFTVFQRSANYLSPRPNIPYPDKVKALFAKVPPLRLAHRFQIYAQLELNYWAFHEGSRKAKKMLKASLDHLHEQVKDPELRKALTPDYPIGCKRILVASDYYPALQQPNASVCTSPIDRVTSNGIVTADGVTHEVDAIIFATGFDTTHFLKQVDIIGRHGMDLHESWADGAEAYLGLAAPGFPNLFMLYGPNTNLGHNSIMFMIEGQVEFILRAIRESAKDNLAALEVRHSASDNYNRRIQKQMNDRVWIASCESWYKNAAGKVTNNWPRTALRYRLMLRAASLDAFSHLRSQH